MTSNEQSADSHTMKKGPENDGQGHLVAKHYNELQEAGRESRTDSRIFYMRNFNNWIKSVVIHQALERLKKDKGHDRDISVLDLCSGKGGDLLKWKKGNIHSIVCVDIAEISVEQSETRYKEMLSRERNPDRIYKAEFLTADCSKERLKDLYKDAGRTFDICSCQFSFHYCFETLSQAEVMLQNAVECLKLGGYFIGTTPNSQELVRRLRESDDMSFGNEVYRVTFENADEQKLPLFGAKYNFHLEGVVDCPEFLVFFPVLEKMAEKYGVKLVYKQSFADFFNQNFETREYKDLLSQMKALESYPAEEGRSLVGKDDEDYEHVRSFIDSVKEEPDSRHHGREPRKVSVGTLSKAEWEAVTIYCVFMFQKVKDMETGEVWKVSTHDGTSVGRERKRLHEGAEEGAEGAEPRKAPRNT